MTYEDSNYFCFCFYSESDLFEQRETRSSLDSSLTELIHSLGLTDLKQSAINRIDEFKLDNIRKTKLKPKPVATIFEKVSHSLDLNILIQSSDWTNENAPSLIVNIFCSNTNKFNGRNIPENPKMFFIAAIAHELISDDYQLQQEAESIFNENNGIKGGIWITTKYTLYDGTPIPWAFQNFPSNSTYSTLEEWNPNFDYKLRKTKANKA